MNNYTWFDTINSIIDARKTENPEVSYTARLFSKGLEQIAKKVAEESVEAALAALADDEAHFKDECADLLFHFMVLLNKKNVPLADVLTVLEKRHERKKQ